MRRYAGAKKGGMWGGASQNTIHWHDKRKQSSRYFVHKSTSAGVLLQPLTPLAKRNLNRLGSFSEKLSVEYTSPPSTLYSICNC
jgi:hypothetical protein